MTVLARGGRLLRSGSKRWVPRNDGRNVVRSGKTIATRSSTETYSLPALGVLMDVFEETGFKAAAVIVC